ncbi:MAG: Fpg/Nei family DNA glycosylase [Anaerolineales bacterium]
MPELPDVAAFKSYFDVTALHQRIEDVEVQGIYPLKEIAPDELREGLRGRAFESTERHGKYLFVALDGDGGWLVLHFGMTGDLKYYKVPEKEPEYDQVLLRFANGYHLAYVSKRKLGEVRLIDDVDAFIEEHDLGPDAMAEDFDYERFKETFGRKGGMVKSALMDQSTLAGIGNVYSDEILFQAGIHPQRKVQDLDEQELRRVYESLKEVLETAIEHNAEPADFPADYLIPHRGEERCPCCDGELQSVKVSGRTGYYCPERQPEP